MTANQIFILVFGSVWLVAGTVIYVRLRRRVRRRDYPLD